VRHQRSPTLEIHTRRIAAQTRLVTVLVTELEDELEGIRYHMPSGELGLPEFIDAANNADDNVKEYTETGGPALFCE
jgi:hypothetical protein